MQLLRIGEQLPCTREPGNSKEPFAVAVVRSCHERLSVHVGPHYCARAAAAASDWVWLTRILARSAKIISAKFCKRPIRENFVPRKFGAIRYCQRKLKNRKQGTPRDLGTRLSEHYNDTSHVGYT